MQAPPAVDINTLLERYDALLLDAYGVLVDASGPLPGADALVRRLEAARRPYFIVTNDASRLPEAVARRFQEFDLPIDTDRIITSGMLLAGHFAACGLQGRPAAVVGPEDSAEYVRRAGGEVVPVDTPFEILVVCDERDVPFLDSANAALSTAYRQLEAGRGLELVLPNPDLIYPLGDGAFGFTAGGLAVLLEHGLTLRYPHREDLRFAHLGKPQPAIFEEAVRRAGTHNVVMIGDQLATDITGANAAGIDSALIAGGVSMANLNGHTARPTWLLPALEHSATA